MSDRFKTLVAYIVSVSILFAWSVFKAWEPPLPVHEGAATASGKQPTPAQSAAPTRVAAD